VLYVSDASAAFDAELELADAKIASLLEDYIRGFSAYCREASPRRSG
jgi:hypothetical protein